MPVTSFHGDRYLNIPISAYIQRPTFFLYRKYCLFLMMQAAEVAGISELEEVGESVLPKLFVNLIIRMIL